MAGSWLLGEVWQRGALLHASRSAQFGELFRWMVPFALIPPFLMSVVRLRLLPQRQSPFPTHDGSGRMAWGRLAWSFIAPVLIAAQAAALLAFCSMFLRSALFQAHGEVVESHVGVVASPYLARAHGGRKLSFRLAGDENEKAWRCARRRRPLVSVLMQQSAAVLGGDIIKTVYGAFSILAFGTAAGYAASLAGWSSATANGLKKIKYEQLSKTGSVAGET